MKVATNKKQSLFNLLGITEEQYIACIRRWGKNFAIACSYDVLEMAQHLYDMEEYWHWWKKQCDIRDEAFCIEFAEYAGTGNENNLMDMWADAHEYRNITGAPPQTLLRRAVEMVTEETKAEAERLRRIEEIIKGI